LGPKSFDGCQWVGGYKKRVDRFAGKNYKIFYKGSVQEKEPLKEKKAVGVKLKKILPLLGKEPLLFKGQALNLDGIGISPSFRRD